METKVIYKFFLSASVNTTEEWLRKMANDGWLLCNMSFAKFVFEKKKPSNVQYFVYRGFDSSRGINYDYFRAKQQYHSKSEINNRHLGVFEADLKKIDKDFVSYIHLRNKYYLKHYLSFSFIVFLAVCFFVYATIQYRALLIFLLFFSSIFVYTVISVFLLVTQSKKREEYLYKTISQFHSQSGDGLV